MGLVSLEQLSELLVSLRGHLGVKELLPWRLRHLGAAEPNEAQLARLAAVMAREDVGDKQFYRHVLVRRALRKEEMKMKSHEVTCIYI